jgi:cob(I)alamin adenosyltransferase
MKSISTMRGDAGETSLAGGIRVSKSSVRVEAYGTIDELNSTLGFARSICDDRETVEFARSVHQDLFTITACIGGPYLMWLLRRRV